MTRSIPPQTAALNILDWLYFNQALVLCTYGEAEWLWLFRLVDRVKSAVARTGATGLEAECLKHTVLCLLEINLHDPIEQQCPPGMDPYPPGTTREECETVEAFKRKFFSAMVIAVGEAARHAPLNAALEIFDELIGQFKAAPITMKYRLVERCLVFEYMAAPLELFAWLTQLRILRSNKCVPTNATKGIDVNTIARIGLLCEFETIRHYMSASLKHYGETERLLEQADQLSAYARQQIADNLHHYRSRALATSHTILTFFVDRLRDEAYVRNFLRVYGRVCFRTRLVTGTQATWLGTLGGAIVSICKEHVTPDKPIYVDAGSTSSVTESVASTLRKRGCTILPRTLYERYREFLDSVCPRLRLYHQAQLRADGTPPSDWQDVFYYGTIVVTSG